MNDCLLWSEAYSPIYANILARTQPHRVRHVYPDDASDIKTHRFFRDIPWNEMLHRPAPYVPEGKNWDETQFFTDKMLQPADLGDKLTGAETCSASKLQGQQNADGSGCVDQQHDEHAVLKMNEILLKAQKGDESKRPRDKILRDAATGPTALNVRLKTAFVGYTWRRASPVTALLGTGRGRKMVQI